MASHNLLSSGTGLVTLVAASYTSRADEERHPRRGAPPQESGSGLWKTRELSVVAVIVPHMNDRTSGACPEVGGDTERMPPYLPATPVGFAACLPFEETNACEDSTVQNHDQVLTCLDLFAGAGGLSEGLREAGFATLYANEVEPVYAKTYALNHANAIVDARDIRLVDADEIRESLGLAQGELDLLAGGPPCQGFSINAPTRTTMDERNHLFKDFLRFVSAFKPKSVLIENVPGLVNFSAGATLAAILMSLADMGYAVDVRILYAPHYGVPQTRWRTIVLGTNMHGIPSPAFPSPEFHAPQRVNFTSKFQERTLTLTPRSPELPRCPSLRDAIGDLPPLQNGEQGPPLKPYSSEALNAYQADLRRNSPGVRNHEAARLSEINLRRLQFIPPGGNWTDIPFELLPRGMKLARRSDHTKRYGRADPDGISSTILTKCDPHWGAYFHYEQDRAFTVREAARLQSFPDRFTFTGSRVAQYEQVGNAVPPALARAVGLAIRTVLGVDKALEPAV